MKNENPILDYAFKLFEAVAPNSLLDPVKAYKKVVETMGWIQIEAAGPISVGQLQDLRDLDVFEGKNLVQIKKMLSGDTPRIGPEPKAMAVKLTMRALTGIGIRATFVPLTREEKDQMLKACDVPE